MALPCGWVANDLHHWRDIGFTSFPKVPHWLAGQQMGLGTHFSAWYQRGNETKSMTLVSKIPCLLAVAPTLLGRGKRKPRYC